MNENPPKTAAKPTSERERTPIPIEKLLFTAANPNGVKVPDGPDGRNERIRPYLNAGIQGEVKIEIDWRPWLRKYYVVFTKKTTRSGPAGKEIVDWLPMGRPFTVPDDWAIAILAED